MAPDLLDELSGPRPTTRQAREAFLRPRGAKAPERFCVLSGNDRRNRPTVTPNDDDVATFRPANHFGKTGFGFDDGKAVRK